MTGKFSYRDYVEDEAFLADYNDYQKKYSDEPRESDKVIIGIVRDLARTMPANPSPRLLDIGCSTGNLLLHLKRQLPGLALQGGDLAQSSLTVCRNNPELEGIGFETLDVMCLPRSSYDIIVVNAVLYMFDQTQYETALKSLAISLRSGGAAVVYDFAHEFEQDIEILEKTKSHPEGLRLRFRPATKIRAEMKKAGFSRVEFRPFELPIDLAQPARNDEIVTYTCKDEKGRRMAFRGTLYQPWCHMIAGKR